MQYNSVYTIIYIVAVWANRRGRGVANVQGGPYRLP